ncbi:signal recognition particle-docking protein FtsY [Anaeromyxobacter paludicola]|uniref:signal recognition particle-docking protein FtsY n=1 Tax=Anaeromyxobacter paludicola TaxID=2918171 RepID=UPI00384FEE37
MPLRAHPVLALTTADAAGIAVLVALVALIVLAAIRLARKKREAAPPAARGGELPPRTTPPVPAPPRPAEKVRPAEKARPELKRLSPEERAAEEARRKEEYRRRKEEERAEKERRRLAREEEARRAEEERQRLLREAEEAKARAAEEERRRVEAEAGKTLAAGLEKTRGGFMSRLNALFGGERPVDDGVLADLEEVLFTADIGVKTATRLLETARERVRKKELSDPAKLKAALREEIARIVSLDGRLDAGEELAIGAQRPFVVMVVGVNGAGKTTTIGKLAAKVQARGHSVLLGAGDTFRAAAGEQLEIWAERVGAPVVRGKEGSDPASVCFEAAKKGAEGGVDVVICDTAGRLHTKAPLMEELKKVKRVIDKAVPGAPHEVLLVLDATNGQNAIAQARQFHEALGVTGIVLTKLDGTAKGGVVIGICDELGLPVRYVGVGEKVADLRPFSPREFVEALFA